MPQPRQRSRERFPSTMNNSSRDRGRQDTRKRSRSFSPTDQKHKRSWQNFSSQNRPQYHHSPPPKKRDFKPARFGPPSHLHKSRSRSPKYKKRNDEGSSRLLPKMDTKPRTPPHGDRTEFLPRVEPRGRKRSLSPRPSSKNDFFRDQGSRKSHPVAHQSPEPSKYHSTTSKKKLARSSPPRFEQSKKFSHDRSKSLSPPLAKKPAPYHQKPSDKDGSLPHRKVSTANKKRTNFTTLHTRFTIDGVVPFRLHTDDNVTIAILRNSQAEPSEDVNVQRIFDSSLFKMVHSKTAGREPIFDREEIKVWRHDENLEDDPDFEEKRVVRVKSASKKPADSLMRMSPDVLRKSFARGTRVRSSSRSPDVRLNPLPDSRYESRYQQQLSREEADDQRRQKDWEKAGSVGRGGRKGEEDHDRFQSDRQSRANDYDLRQALERRRGGKDEDFDRSSRMDHSGSRKYFEDDRNVVMDTDRGRSRGSVEMGRGRRAAWDPNKRRGWGRSRGRGFRGGFSPRQSVRDHRDTYDSRDNRSYDRNEGFSPGNTRGRGGFRGRGRVKNVIHYEEERSSPPADDYYKYAQHDDRDIDPRSFQGRGQGTRFIHRGFRGSRGFQPIRRGRGFRSSRRGRGGFFRRDGSRSVERDVRRSVEHSSEREWKHDMYDTVQSEDEEVPHSTTVST